MLLVPLLIQHHTKSAFSKTARVNSTAQYSTVYKDPRFKAANPHHLKPRDLRWYTRLMKQLKTKQKRFSVALTFILIAAVAAYLGFDLPNHNETATSAPASYIEAAAQHVAPSIESGVTLSDNGEYYIYDITPDFGELKSATESFEYYSSLDNKGRCGVAVACLGQDLMPTEKRESIYEVKPTGWHSSRYEFIDGESLYNRSHLIAFSLAGENANERNLITGTRQLNLAMNDFEILVANYIRKTGNHVLYRVTPVFEGNDLVALGVQMEAKSVEDNGQGICFNIYIPNEQVGVTIDYATGDNWLASTDLQNAA